MKHINKIIFFAGGIALILFLTGCMSSDISWQTADIYYHRNLGKSIENIIAAEKAYDERDMELALEHLQGGYLQD